MAEGIIRHFYGSKFKTFSADARVISVHPLTMKVIAEMGIDISKQRSKTIEEFFSLEFSYVITCEVKMPKPYFRFSPEKPV